MTGRVYRRFVISGTELTKPGRGVSVARLWRKVANRPLASGCRDCLDTLRRLNDLGVAKGISYRTNIRLTNAPLTEDDLRRIEEAK